MDRGVLIDRAQGLTSMSEAAWRAGATARTADALAVFGASVLANGKIDFRTLVGVAVPATAPVLRVTGKVVI